MKFHINKHGVPSPCRAKKGNCPYGGETGEDYHFENLESAEEYANDLSSRTFRFVNNERIELSREEAFDKFKEIIIDKNMKIDNDIEGGCRASLTDPGYPGHHYVQIEIDVPKEDVDKLKESISQYDFSNNEVLQGTEEELSGGRSHLEENISSMTSSEIEAELEIYKINGWMEDTFKEDIENLIDYNDDFSEYIDKEIEDYADKYGQFSRDSRDHFNWRIEHKDEALTWKEDGGFKISIEASME